MSASVPLISICIPTNGVDEVFSSLDSIYRQNVDNNLFEVVVTNNGDSVEFHNRMLRYSAHVSNLKYKETDAKQFLNQLEAFKLAQAPFVKFLNHRMALVPGSLLRLVEYVENHQDDHSIIYYSNGTLPIDSLMESADFNQFVETLSYQASWSGGLAFWKNDFTEWGNAGKTSALFPHCGILFSVRSGRRFFIDNEPLLVELNSSHANKGTYSLFRAFAIEFPSIILELYRDGDISIETLRKVLDDNLTFIAGLYINFLLLHKPCSYDLSDFNDSINVFYNNAQLRRRVISRFARQFFRIR